MVLNDEEARQIMARVRENHKKLASCKRHSFGPVLGEGDVFARRKGRKCINCSATMPDRDIVFYAKGYAAAGGNPDDVAKFCDGGSVL